jgi:hypothetical protein
MLFFLSYCSGRGQFIIIPVNFPFSCTFAMDQFSSAPSTNEIHRTFTVGDPCALTSLARFVLRPVATYGIRHIRHMVVLVVFNRRVGVLEYVYSGLFGLFRVYSELPIRKASPTYLSPSNLLTK